LREPVTEPITDHYDFKVGRSADGQLFSKWGDFFRRQKEPIKVNMFRAALQYYLITLVVYYQSIYITTLGATPVQVGLAVGIGGIAGAAIAVPAGLLADRYGVKSMFLVGTVAMALGVIVLGSVSRI
jgi:MFS family permease